jgi:type I restriction enzyme S subunit
MILRDFTTIFKDVTGGNLKVMKSDYLSEGNYPVIDQGKELIGGYSNIDQVVKRKGEVIVFGDHTGCLKFVNFDFLLGADGVKVIQPKYDVLDAKYAYYLLHKVHIPDTGYDRKFKYLKSTKIPLPPLPTQKKIAAILDAADAHRQKTKQLLAKYDELAQSIFLEMFGDPVTNPKGWEVINFDELVSEDCPLTYGIVQPGEEYEHGIPCVRPVDLTHQYVGISNLKKIDPSISKKFKRTILKGGELLLSVRGSVGVLSIAKSTLKGCNVTRGIVPIWFDSEVSNKIFFYYLYKSISVQRRLSELSKGATLIQINLKDLRDLRLIKPRIETQNRFAERVSLIEEQIEKLNDIMRKSEDLFNSLLQKAFKGELGE